LALEKEGMLKEFCWKSLGKRPVGKATRKSKNGTKMGLREVGGG
jgi:hypothetical protein